MIRCEILESTTGFGFSIREESLLENRTNDVIRSSQIEGEKLNQDIVISTIPIRLRMNNQQLGN